MEQMLIVHISSLFTIIILSIVLLVNSIKTKNKLVMYLSIGTLVVSIGCLTYCLIHHFNKQHHANNHVTLPTLSVSKPVYNKSMQNVKKILDSIMDPSYSIDFSQKEYDILKKCIASSQTISDLTHQLLKNKGDTFIEEMVEMMKKAKEGSPPTPDDMQKMIEFCHNLLTIMKNDCKGKDIEPLLEKFKKSLPTGKQSKDYKNKVKQLLKSLGDMRDIEQLSNCYNSEKSIKLAFNIFKGLGVTTEEIDRDINNIKNPKTAKDHLDDTKHLVVLVTSISAYCGTQQQ